MAKIGKPRSSKGLATLCARLAEDKIAKDVILMDLTALDSSPAEFFVLCSCDSDIQVRAIADNVMRTSKTIGLDKPKEEGTTNAEWVIIDFFDVMMHIMQEKKRSYYAIEKLWADAKFFKLNEKGEPRVIKFEEISHIFNKRDWEEE